MTNSPSTLALVGVTQVFEAAPVGSEYRVIDHAFAYNPGAAVVYLNLWIATATPVGTPTEAAVDRVGGPWPIAPGASIALPIGVPGLVGAILSATTGTDATGAPASAAQVVLSWVS